MGCASSLLVFRSMCNPHPRIYLHSTETRLEPSSVQLPLPSLLILILAPPLVSCPLVKCYSVGCEFGRGMKAEKQGTYHTPSEIKQVREKITEGRVYRVVYCRNKFMNCFQLHAEFSDRSYRCVPPWLLARYSFWLFYTTSFYLFILVCHSDKWKL